MGRKELTDPRYCAMPRGFVVVVDRTQARRISPMAVAVPLLLLVCFSTSCSPSSPPGLAVAL